MKPLKKSKNKSAAVRRVTARVFAASFVVSLAFFIAGCGGSTRFTDQRAVFGGLYCRLDLRGRNANAAGEEIFAALINLDGEVSTSLAWDGGERTKKSPVYEFNEKTDKYPGYRIEVGYNLFRMANECAEIYADAAVRGAFNPAVYPLVELWGVSTDDWAAEHTRPLDEIAAGVDALLSRCDFSRIETVTDAGKYYLKIKETAPAGMSADDYAAVAREMKIDFGGYAKGYAADRAGEICKKYGLEFGMVNISGNLYLYGERADGKPTIAVADPRDPSGYPFMSVVYPGTVSPVTSGTYERKYMVNDAGREYENGTYADGNVYVNHIVDPRSGWPVNLKKEGGKYLNTPGGVISATIFNASSALADAYATTVCVLGEEDGIKFLTEKNLDALLITADGRYYISADFTLREFSRDPKDASYLTFGQYSQIDGGGRLNGA